MDNLTNMSKAQLFEQLNLVRDQRDVITTERDSHMRSLDRALAQIERMLIDRDVLRRELSQVIASYHGENDVDIAVERGWNCFENCTQVEGEWLVNGGKA